MTDTKQVKHSSSFNSKCHFFLLQYGIKIYQKSIVSNIIIFEPTKKPHDLSILSIKQFE